MVVFVFEHVAAVALVERAEIIGHRGKHAHRPVTVGTPPLEMLEAVQFAGRLLVVHAELIAYIQRKCVCGTI